MRVSPSRRTAVLVPLREAAHARRACDRGPDTSLPPRASTAPLRTSESLSQATDRALDEHGGFEYDPAQSCFEPRNGNDENACPGSRSVSPHAALTNPSEGDKRDGPRRGKPKMSRATVRRALDGELAFAGRLLREELGLGRGTLDSPARGVSGAQRSPALRNEAAPFAARKKKRLSGAANAAREVHAHDGFSVPRPARKRRRETIEANSGAVAELLENHSDAAATPARRDERRENDVAETPGLPRSAVASRARARDGSDEEGDDIDEENQHLASRLGDVGRTLEIAIGAPGAAEKTPPGTPSRPVTPFTRTRLIAASDEGLRRVQSGDFSPQVAVLMSKEEIDERERVNKEGNAGGDRSAILNFDFHRQARDTCYKVCDEYRRLREDGTKATRIGQVFAEWFPCCKDVQTPRLRKIAEKHLSEGHHDSVELAVYRLVQALVAILKLGGFLHDGDNVDDVISASVTDKTIFAADGKTHHPQGHKHRAGVSTGDTKAHQDQSARGITVALSMVLADENSNRVADENSNRVAHVLEQLHHTFVLYPEGAFARQTYANGSGVQQRARHGSVIRRVQYGNTRCEEVRVMTISPVENAHYMHRIANPDGAARVLIQFVIDPGFSLEWAERATAWLRRFFGQRLSPTSVEETEMSEAARKVLSVDPNKWKSAELPAAEAEADDPSAASAMTPKTSVQDLLSKLGSEEGMTVAEIAVRCNLTKDAVKKMMERHGGDDGVFFRFGTKIPCKWRIRRDDDPSAASAKDKKRNRSEDGRDDDANAALAKRKKW